jgi:copper chaperone
MATRTLTVTGMSCTGCEASVEDALAALDGVERVAADHEADTVELVADGSVSDDDIAAVVDEAGYELAG